MGFEEQPDGDDIHGECAAESDPPELSAFETLWAMLSKVPYMSKKEIASRAFYAGEMASNKSRFDACRPYLKEGETAADALIRMQKEVTTLRNAAMQLWGDRSACDKEDAARYRWLLEHPTFAVHCFIYLPGQVSAEIDNARTEQEGE